MLILCLEDAMSREDKKQWVEAMKSEIDSLLENDTWVCIDKPTGVNVVKTKWVFKLKKEQEGKVRYKARLVMKGFTQKKGIDYDETYSPVVRYSSLRYLIALATRHELEIHQMDAVTAFLQGELNEDIYAEKPEGIEIGSKDQVLKLKKAIYGLKQSSLVWNMKLNRALQKLGLQRSKVDPCIYYHHDGRGMTFLAIYVDDILMFSNEPTYREDLISKLMKQFKMKYLGEAKHCLGIRISRNNDGIYLDQEEYIDEMLKNST